ncbi:hypothetical protein OF897_15835 [Chryseobacterium formosus]|uniref:Lipoprotein n=1 Tax=Chryseobacterium formosus TaxID=1537363 RepID=A0ABT3XUQ3_9FLAO|nr:hypothetical protein [Chryseobacterium formosus]MCX8525385.1 hypothetical protein [Chryseobacterium formosus]
MNKLLILCFAVIMSCASTTAKKSDNMQNKSEILASESNGGTEKEGFKIIKDQEQLKKEITENFASSGMEPVMDIPVFPNDKKVVLYNLGRFNSGDHKVNEIKSISVKDNVLYVEVPMYESGGMEIQVLSNPWFIFSVPSSYKFTSIQLNPTK